MALAELDRMASRLELPKSVRHSRCELQESRGQAPDLRALDRRCCSSFLYAACRQCGVPSQGDRTSLANRTQGNRLHLPVYGS